MNFREVCLMRWVVFALVMSVVSVNMARAALTLVDEGVAKAVIVSNGHKAQAENLQSYLKKLSGAEVPIVAERAEVPAGQAVIELRLVATVPGASTRLSAADAYRLQSDDKELTLSAATDMALHYAVWGLLEDHFGVLFLDEKVERIPSSATLTLEPLQETAEPAFIARRGIDEGNRPWLVKNRGGGAQGLWSNHSFYTWIKPSVYFEEHPEWFAQMGGKRQTHAAMSLCGTNAALATELAKNLMVTMAKTDPSIPLRVGQGDGFSPCQCEECRALVRAEGSESAPYILMLNRALDITSKEYPRHMLVTFAYYATLYPPTTLRPHANLYINVVSTGLGSDSDQLGPVRDNPRNAEFQRATESWSKLAPGRVSVWHWAADFRAMTTEWPDIFNMCDNIRLWHEQGVAAVHPQYGAGNWIALRRWLYTKLMWNPAADEEKLITTFLAAYYGEKAAPILLEYLRYSASRAVESKLAAGAHTDPDVLRTRIFTDETLQHMATLMESALQAAQEEDDPAYAARVTTAIATSIDVLRMLGTDGKLLPFTRTIDPRDGREWLVPGGDPRTPERIDRVNQVYLDDPGNGLVEWSAPWHSRLRFLGYVGGPLTRFESPTLAVEVLPNVDGQITSVIHKASGKELMAWDTTPRRLLAYNPASNQFGYGALTGYAQQWTVPATQEPGSLLLIGDLHRDIWWNAVAMRVNQQIHRTITLAEDGPTLTLDRKFVGTAITQDYLAGCALRNPTTFRSRWRFAVPIPALAQLKVTGGGLTMTIPLNSREKVERKFTEKGGVLQIELDRGDGLIVRYSTDVAGWDDISITPLPDQQQVAIMVSGIPLEMDRSARTIELTSQQFEVVTKEP